MKLFNIQNSKLKMLFTVLFLGALWGFLETTLGTILHLDAFDSIFFASTAVMVPVAYLVCATAYKMTGTVRSTLYVGLIAAAIKAICFAFVPTVNKVVNPMVSIVLESLFSGVVIYLVKPTKVLSVKSFISFAIMSLAYRLVYMGYSMLTEPVFKSAYIKDGVINFNNIISFVVTTNYLSLAYTALFLGIGYGINAIFVKTNKQNVATQIKNFLYSPICATLMVAIAITVTVVLK